MQESLSKNLLLEILRTTEKSTKPYARECIKEFTLRNTSYDRKVNEAICKGVY